MIHIVTAENAPRYAEALEQAWRLRHRVFVEEKGWSDLARPDGREIDGFDDAHALHMLAIEAGTVVGYQRMLPTTRPYLLTEVLSELCEVEPPRSPHVWEWTRYAVERGHRDRGRILSPVGSALLTGIVEWGLESGVDAIVIEMNPLWLLRLVQLHFRVTPLGLPRPIAGEETVAVSAAFDERTLARLRATRGDDATVLSARPGRPLRLAS
ncbi:acyl-homoserine-lactone synthase [Methylobacterium radiodurans]|uniref:Acyl-homoserine-lactone synthase n=1 Tax=Methylobacterium radiodurans TaxID=2202828 RepID=A0A2U8VYD0_9HYPH|nr:GNAT family N-acetyltransferase [Methylobacterium radiodurans]AWN38176.1 autoinducer synthase [Methylobacterium radiodurans]